MERAASKETVQQPFLTLAFGAGCGVHVLVALVQSGPQWQSCSITVSCIWNGRGTRMCVTRHYHT